MYKYHRHTPVWVWGGRLSCRKVINMWQIMNKSLSWRSYCKKYYNHPWSPLYITYELCIFLSEHEHTWYIYIFISIMSLQHKSAKANMQNLRNEMRAVPQIPFQHDSQRWRYSHFLGLLRANKGPEIEWLTRPLWPLLLDGRSSQICLFWQFFPSNIYVSNIL